MEYIIKAMTSTPSGRDFRDIKKLISYGDGTGRQSQDS